MCVLVLLLQTLQAVSPGPGLRHGSVPHSPGLRAAELQTEPCTSRTRTSGGLGGAGAPLPASPPARFALHRPIQSLRSIHAN